jgi:hypothetical protein
MGGNLSLVTMLLLAGFVLLALLQTMRYVSSCPLSTNSVPAAILPVSNLVAKASSVVTFDFDTGTPALSAGQSTPLDQTSGGVTTHFSSPSDPAFSVQNHDTTFFTLSQFSGLYLYPNNIYRNALDIKFSQQLSNITLTFATVDYHDNTEVPGNITLTAYLNSTETAPVGSATNHGTFANDTYPMGILSYYASGQPFDLVEIVVPYQPSGTTSFLLDNITVTTADAVPELNTIALLGFGVLSLTLTLLIRKRRGAK